MIQTAEGALDETTNILQRMRELSVQASSGTYNDANRGTMDAEVQQLKAEIDRIAENTSFNGLKLLDGTITGVDLQVGANAGETINFSIGEINTAALGTGDEGGVSAVGTSAALSTGDLSINGIDVPASKAGDDTSSTVNADQSSISKAAAINSISDQTGVTAIVDENVVAGAAMTGAATTGTVVLNGTSFNVTTSTDTAASRAALVETINLKSAETGITAIDSGDDTQGVTLEAADGRNINIAYTGTTTSAATGLAAAGTNTGGFTLVADGDVSEIVIGGGANIANSGLAAGTYAAGTSTVTSTAQVAQGSAAAIADVTEVSTVTFGDLDAGESVTVDGLTFTSTGNELAADIASMFAGLPAGDDGATSTTGTVVGTWSGALSANFSAGAAAGADVAFTAATANFDVTNIAVSTDAAGAGAPVAATTQGTDLAGEEFTSLMKTLTVAGADGDGTITFDGEAVAFADGSAYSATQVADAFEAAITIGGTTTDGNWQLTANDGAGTLTWLAVGANEGDITDPDGTEFVYTDGGGSDTAPADPTATTTVQGVDLTTESSVLTFSQLEAGETATVDGLTYTSTGTTTADELAAAFANVAATTTPANLLTGTFSGALSANFASAGATTNTVTFTAQTAGAVTDITTSGTAAGGVSVSTVEGSAAVVAGAANYDDLSAGDLSINGTVIRAADSADDTASYDAAGSSSKEASGISIAAAINDSTAETGVTATVQATAATGTLNTAAYAGTSGNTGSLELNGLSISLTDQGSYEDNVAHAVSQINANSGQTGVTAEDSGSGLTLTAADGRNIVAVVDSNAAGTGIEGDDFGLGGTSIGEADLTAAGPGDTAIEQAVTTYSTVQLTSAGTIEVAAGSNGNAGLEGLGLEVGDFGGAVAGQFLKDVDISTVEGAQKALGAIDNALESINDVRADLGAVNNRLDFTINNLSNVSENTAAARSRIEDADFASESAALSRAQVLQQAGTAMLAQANAAPQQVLSLLQ
jgi:flagellin